MTAIHELVDAKIAAAEARTDIKFGQLIGEMQLMNQRLGHIEAEQQSLKSNIWTATSIVIGAMIGILALMATLMPWAFDLGGAVGDQIRHEVATQLSRR